jgi:hypothetical protein
MNVYNKLFLLITQHIKNINNGKSKRMYDFSGRSYDTRISAGGRTEDSSGEGDSSYIKVLLEQLRVPLCCYIEYKGICALATDITNIS